MTDPIGAEVVLDGESVGRAPWRSIISPGRHTLRLTQEGFAPIERQLDLGGAEEVVAALQDVAPPEIALDPLPDRVAFDAGLKVSASAKDNVGVTGIALYIDGTLLQQTDEGFMRHNVDTLSLAPGAHLVRITAWDAANHVAETAVTVQVGTPGATKPPASAALSPQDAGMTSMPMAAETSSPTRASTATATPPAYATTVPTAPAAVTPDIKVQPTAPTEPVQVYWSQVTIDTYAYEDARYADAELAGHPYSLLTRERVLPPRPVTYDTLVARNQYLELTFLPALGGRLYQCRFLPTGQTLLYNNAVIKPTNWGPEDQGWWLAVGGMEFALPVHEHGYVSAEPWQAGVTRYGDGSATITMSILEQSHRLWATVAFTLKPGESRVTIESTITNRHEETQRFQYWINAMLSPGAPGVKPTLRLYLPTDDVIVHSAGDLTLPQPGGRLPWPIYAGRDWSVYGTWKNWLGAFAPRLQAPYTAVYDPAVEVGMVQITPPDLAGHKLFGFGSEFDWRAYTDDGYQYVEMWSGLTPTFWDDAELAPGESTGWREVWYPISRCGGVSYATEQATLHVTAENGQLQIGVYAPLSARWRLVVEQGGEVLLNQPFAVSPGDPYKTSLALSVGNPAEPVSVQVLDASGDPVVSHVLQRSVEAGS